MLGIVLSTLISIAAVAEVEDAGPSRSALAVFERFAGSGSTKS